MALTSRDRTALDARALGGDLYARAFVAQQRDIDALWRAVNGLAARAAAEGVTAGQLVGLIRFEDLTPSVDGTQTVFVTSLPFVEGTLRVYSGGLLLSGPTLSYVTETSPSTGSFTLSVAPTHELTVEYIRA